MFICFARERRLERLQLGITKSYVINCVSMSKEVIVTRLLKVKGRFRLEGVRERTMTISSSSRNVMCVCVCIV